MIAGWFADKLIIQWLIERFSRWLGVAASTMDTEIGFLFGLVFAILLVKMYGHTLGIVIQGTLVGYAANRITVLVMENQDMDTDKWYLMIDHGVSTAVYYAAEGTQLITGVASAGIQHLAGVVG